jgi:hypothetical protein
MLGNHPRSAVRTAPACGGHLADFYEMGRTEYYANRVEPFDAVSLDHGSRSEAQAHTGKGSLGSADRVGRTSRRD